MEWPLSNVYIGVTVESESVADDRIADLCDIPAVKRFVSCEPLLGPVDLTHWISHIDQVIVGGESGPGARPMSPGWVRSIRDQCAEAGVPCFFKQWGEWLPGDQDHIDVFGDGMPKWSTERGNLYKWNASLCSFRIGRKRAGRNLDGVQHDELIWR